jgi:hypothetical protein
MRIFLTAAAVIALLAGPAFAQKSIPKYGEDDKDKTPSEKEADKAAEQAYKRSLGNIPDQGSTDPWGTVRSDNSPKTAKTTAKTAAKPASAKPAKTDSTAK